MEVVLEGQRVPLGVTLGVKVVDVLKHKLGLPDKVGEAEEDREGEEDTVTLRVIDVLTV